MKRFEPVGSLYLISLLASLALSGCASSLSFPDSPAPLVQNDLGTINGSVFGGHAPLVGAHVYVIQPGQSGYGSQASTLLSATYSGSYPTTKNTGGTDGDVPNSWYFVTTDAKGGFNITGDYSCTVGLPVFLYAYGGTPTLPTSGTPASHSFTVNNVTETDAPASYGLGYKTLTWTTTAQNLFYTGEVVTASSFGSGDINGTQTVVATPAYNQFVTIDFLPLLGNGSHNISGTITANPQPNPDAVNMATLGVCPSSGNFSTGATAISFVYMNEVSTAATAYAFQGFTAAAFNDAFHIGSSGTLQGNVGLQNAALTAANLYDIQGSTTSTTYQGEGHIARYVTPAGNGIVPTRLLNTIGNILAACVDSNSSNTNGVSPACHVLLSTTSSDGTTGGNNPPDTATAAFYMARYPAGNGQPNYVSNLFGLPSATVPFSPALATQPNDFTLAVQFPVSGTAADGSTTVSNPFLGRAESVTIDSKGNVWGTAQTGNYSFELTNAGAKLCTYSTSYIYGYLAIDINDKPWAGNANATTGITKLSPATSGTTCNTAYYNANNYHQAYTVVNDGSGNTYFMAQNSSGSGPFNIYEFPIGASTATPATYVSQPFSAGTTIAHASIDNSTGNFWITNENGTSGSTYGKVVAATGVPLFTLTAADGQPEVPAIDSSNNAWITEQNTAGAVLKVNSTGSSVKTFLSSTSTTVGPKFAVSFGSAIDGNGNVWITNRGSIAPNFNGSQAGINSIVELTSSGVAISPVTNYLLGGILNDPLNEAIDPSGNMWITNYGGNQLVELIGTAAPVVTPISVASHNGALGTKP